MIYPKQLIQFKPGVRVKCINRKLFTKELLIMTHPRKVIMTNFGYAPFIAWAVDMSVEGTVLENSVLYQLDYPDLPKYKIL